MARLLFNIYNAPTDHLNQDARTPLHTAVEGSKLSIVRLLLEADTAPTEVTDLRGSTPLALSEQVRRGRNGVTRV